MQRMQTGHLWMTSQNCHELSVVLRSLAYGNQRTRRVNVEKFVTNCVPWKTFIN